jgi:ABC-type dipeptide/oligopeptide/nickel transport system ATPase subunit
MTSFLLLDREKYEHKFIGEIVEGVLNKMKVKKTTALHVGDYLVGLEHQKQHVISLLNGGSDDEVNMVGIHGIGGVGKTTLSKVVYNSIVNQFQSSCFLEDVRENTQKKGLEYLQNNLLFQIIGKDIDIPNVTLGISILRERLQHMKVLLLLDDVDNEEQLQAIAGGFDWFGRGSRVIITTRNQRLLTLHGIERRYEVKELNDKDAFELVRWKVFCNKKTEEDFSGFVHVLEQAVAYASGLPLALKVLGSHFSNRTIEECETELDDCERVPDEKIHMTLKLSFDALTEEHNVNKELTCPLNYIY